MMSLNLTTLSSVSSQFPITDDTDYETDVEFDEKHSSSFYRKDLPIFKLRNSIISEIKCYPVTLISGHTGCGKVSAYFFLILI
jgi:HrpA-like RNA helicase